MGVQLYLLDRRQIPLVIAGRQHLIGTLRSAWKLTEIDAERAEEISEAAEMLKGTDSPAAAMLAEVDERPLLGAPTKTVAAHLVIGWEPQRSSVTDWNWDFLPVLGFAVRDPDKAGFVLHEERESGLIPMTAARAVELSVLNGEGRLLQHGQPSITKCLAVTPFTKSYAIANCELADGRTAELITDVTAGSVPPGDWYIGKLPSETRVFFIDIVGGP